MTPKLLFALGLIASAAVCALFLALEFQAPGWFDAAIGISTIIAAMGFVAVEAKEESQDTWE